MARIPVPRADSLTDTRPIHLDPEPDPDRDPTSVFVPRIVVLDRRVQKPRSTLAHPRLIRRTGEPAATTPFARGTNPRQRAEFDDEPPTT